MEQPKTDEAASESEDLTEDVKPLEIQSTNRESLDENLQNESEERKLKYGAIHVIQLFVPILICMLMVVFTVKLIPYYTQEEKQRLIYAPFAEDGEDDKHKLLSGLGNALIMMCLVVVTTFIIILLYKYRFYKLIHALLFMSSMITLSFFTLTYVSEVLRYFEFPLDIITVLLIGWNICIVGLVAIHWLAPLRLQQAYLIYVSAQVALIFTKFLPPWTTWIVLGLLIIWDLIAVLSPRGPLRMLVELAQERNEPIFPAMIYSTIVYATNSSAEANTPQEHEDANEDTISTTPVTVQSRSSESERANVMLGLGDFVFYSILVGKASMQNDWNTTIACFIAILVGLSLTILLLAIFKKALPALPISLALGLTFLFSTRVFVQPFADALSEAQVYI